jgi:CheY-like chemotaxis protein
MNRSILIVDDNEDFLDLLDYALSRKGYTIHTAKSGREGLARVEKCGTPDLILIDVQMPDMTGCEFVDKICGNSLHRRNIVYCTAGQRPEDGRVLGYLNKMTDLSEFIASVRRFADAN